MLIERDSSLKTVMVQDSVLVTNLALCKCYALNGTAGAIWLALEAPRTVDEICTLLAEGFDIEPEECRVEVDALIAKWVRLGLVHSLD